MDDNGVAQIANSDGDIVMKIIVSAVIALSVLAGIAAPASAFDAKGFYGQLERAAALAAALYLQRRGQRS